ncbi:MULTISPECIES: hypothetical protein [Streptomyces]|nr:MULTISPECIES: hypothetical protein [unclassified Streptomyces]WDV34409.1 hypothetical protein OIM90_15710 [Streptomyces sp. AD16]
MATTLIGLSLTRCLVRLDPAHFPDRHAR